MSENKKAKLFSTTNKVDDKEQVGNKIKYQGKVKVSVERNHKVLYKNKAKNQGYDPLFFFLLDCLSGNYYEKNRPIYLRLFTGDSSSVGENSFSATNVSSYGVECTSETISTNNKSTTLTFIVPVSSIYSADNITILALFSLVNVNNTSNPSTAVVLEEPIDTTQLEPTDSIVISWTMELDNGN